MFVIANAVKQSSKYVAHVVCVLFGCWIAAVVALPRNDKKETKKHPHLRASFYLDLSIFANE